MKKEAEIYVAEDQKKRELIEARNLTDNLIYTTEKTLREMGEKISSEIKKEIEEKLEELKKVRESDNIEDIKQKTADLSQLIQKIGAELYKATQENPPAGESQGGKESKDGEEPKEEPKAKEGEYKES